MTNTIANAQKKQKKRKWQRSDARGILTKKEREQLSQGFMACERHIRYRVGMKTWKAINEDLPLIFSAMKPNDFLEFEQHSIPPALEFLKNLVIYCYRLEERRFLKERQKEGLKMRVAFREAWKPVMETIREAKNEISNKQAP